jgi:hypothetical protein
MIWFRPFSRRNMSVHVSAARRHWDRLHLQVDVLVLVKGCATDTDVLRTVLYTMTYVHLRNIALDSYQNEKFLRKIWGEKPFYFHFFPEIVPFVTQGGKNVV